MSTRRQETRERILAAARRLLVERGYHGVGVAEIARGAGVTRQAVYGHHFASKTELLLALVDYVDRVEKIGEAFKPVAAARSGTDALDRAIRAVGTISPKVYGLARVLDAARNTDPAAEAAWQNRMTIRRDGIAAVMGRVDREGHLKAGWTVATATDLVLTMLSIQSYQQLVRESGWSVAEFVERTTETLRATLIRGAPRRARAHSRAGAKATKTRSRRGLPTSGRPPPPPGSYR
jgi:AcrR family transcriptional regulator